VTFSFDIDPNLLYLAGALWAFGRCLLHMERKK
jgi:hypothetical protein